MANQRIARYGLQDYSLTPVDMCSGSWRTSAARCDLGLHHGAPVAVPSRSGMLCGVYLLDRGEIVVKDARTR